MNLDTGEEDTQFLGIGGSDFSMLESGDASALARLFPRDRKIRASLDRIADLEGFVGPGPLVEALRRYLAGKSEVRFEGAADAGPESGTVRVRGLLSSRDGAGRRDQVRLMFAFERDGRSRHRHPRSPARRGGDHQHVHGGRLHHQAREREPARQFVAFLASPAVIASKRRHGFEPA